MHASTLQRIAVVALLATVAIAVPLLLIIIAQSPTSTHPTGTSVSAPSSKNIVLFYDDYPSRRDPQFQVTEEIVKPLVAHADQFGNPSDWMFDSFIFYNLWLYHTNDPTQNFIDSWIEYLFDHQQVTNLDFTVAQIKSVLGQPNYRLNVFVTIPVASNDINASSIDKNLNSILTRWYALNPTSLRLVGFYWGYTEDLADGGLASVLSRVADDLHSKGLKFLIIPYLNAAGYQELHNIGFDYVIMQPNFAFDRESNLNDFAKVNSAIDSGFVDGVELELELREVLCCGADWRTSFEIYLNQSYGYGWNRHLTAYYHGSSISQLGRDLQNPDYKTAYNGIYNYIVSSRTQSVSTSRVAIYPQEFLASYSTTAQTLVEGRKREIQSGGGVSCKSLPPLF